MHTRWKTYFRVLLIGFFLVVIGYATLEAWMRWMDTTMAKQHDELSQKEQELQAYHQLSGFDALQAMKELEGKYVQIPWSENIQKIIAMLASLRNFNVAGGDMMILSDFQVTLDGVSFRGRVSDLALLYTTDPQRGTVSLIDRFKGLDFLEDIRIKQYTRENDAYSFVLTAKVKTNGK